MFCFSFYCHDKEHDQKQLREESVYFSLELIVHHPGKPGRQLKQGANLDAGTAGATEE